MNPDDIPNLERIAFFPGQRLLAGDLTEVQDADRELRWLHNRSLHAWGIGLAFGVTGEAGDSAVRVEPGYGIDCLGREIILTEPRLEPIPAVAGDQNGEAVEYFLVAMYQDDAAQRVQERRRGTCVPEGTVRLVEDPLLTWKKRDALREGYELVLAQVWILNCRLARPVSLAPRRSARPSSAPYIAVGQTAAGATAWTPWIQSGAMVGVAVEIDTSAARFRATPRYTVQLVGERVLPSPPLLAVGLPMVTAPKPDRFTVNVLFPAIGPAFNPPVLLNPATGPDTVQNVLKWSVAWMGVEP
jgi:hypothetical protein